MPDAGLDLTPEANVLLRWGFSPRSLRLARELAEIRGDGADVISELVRLGALEEVTWWRSLADDLGVEYLAQFTLPQQPEGQPPPDPLTLGRIRRVWWPDGRLRRLVVAPKGGEIEQLRGLLAEDPELRQRVAIASPRTIRRTFAASHAALLLRHATQGLRIERPEMSAAPSATLASSFGLALATIVSGMALVPDLTLAAMNGLFLTAGGIRLLSARPRMIEAESLRGSSGSETCRPTYAVLVPLYREVAVLPELCRALQLLDYPADRLRIVLVVEADDLATLTAAETVIKASRIEIIAVPPAPPRTKPKALRFALAQIEAELVTVFDAEDRPAPDQLLRAADAFAAGDPSLACVQACLGIDHAVASQTWLARQFALEYRVLFRSLLPWLAAHRLLLPLGGTSNHFRREALDAVGAWDPHTVTEDIDIAIRLFRAGYRIGTIDCVTGEEAPLHWRSWHLQRVRWMKGWIQTWLVHMRTPVRLARQLGIVNFAMLQILVFGQFLAALMFPIGLSMIVLELTGLVSVFADRTFSGDIVLAFHLIALLGGWLGTVAAYLSTFGEHGNARPWRFRDLGTLPVYWALITGATFHALYEFVTEPSRWNKTQHGIARRTSEPSP